MRYITPFVEKDLARKMVLISGPRQAGKTRLAKAILKSLAGKNTQGLYLNWDDSKDRKEILKRSWSEDLSLIVLDEIHKYRPWKRWLKGLFDTTGDLHKYLVTGSARLDVYRKGGDSMLGRFHSWRLHPFCLAECPPSVSPEDCFQRLLQLGGFPEPFFSEDPIEAKRWRRERRDLVIREDIRDLEQIRDITLLSVLHDLLSTRVGGPIVVSNLAEDLQVAPKTVKHWLEIFDRMYLTFPVLPFSKSLPRALSKPAKIYFYDNAEVDGSDPGAKFENLVATHLLKRLHFLEDSQGDRYELRYLRDKEKHEVDFLILRDRRPLCLIEAKWADAEPHSGLTYFGDRLGVRNRIQVVAQLQRPAVRNGISIVSAVDWLSRPLTENIFGESPS